MPLPWFVVQTNPNEEFRAVRSIARELDCRTCLPLRVTKRLMLKNGRPVMQDGKKVETERLRPLIPRYLFVSFDPADPSWREIRYTVGVTRLFCHERGTELIPSALPYGVVEEIQRRGRAGDGAIDPGKPTDPNWVVPLAVGEEVRVADGPFTSFGAVIEEIITGKDDETRVRALVSIFGRSSKVELGLRQVERVK